MTQTGTDRAPRSGHDGPVELQSSSGEGVAGVSSSEIESGDFDPKKKVDAAVIAALDTNEDTIHEEFVPITLPESTHTLLFTEPIHSRAFQFSFSIVAISILCLLLALINFSVTKKGYARIPANVGTAVKIAQFASIFIALLMEEEIPTGLYLLRRIPRQYFKSKFPELKYHKFVGSCCLRIFMGYLFLANVFLILMVADDVIEIFFDFIAIQFLQQIDDIAFNLCTMGVFSKSLRIATTNRYFRTEFKKELNIERRSKRINLFLKAIYFFNLICLLGGQVFITVKQSNGDFQCQSITVIMQDEVWEESVVQIPGEEKDRKKESLIYPYFNGVYNQVGSNLDGRPVYVEQTKFDGTPFDTLSPEPEFSPVKVPAQIRYCKSIRAWVFLHEHIRKSPRDDSDCPWLLRSEETDAYDIEEVQGPWYIWSGVIGRSNVDIVCNECIDDSDCNLNGICQKDGRCECFDNAEGVQYLGTHCEVRLKDDCRTIYGEMHNETWSVLPVNYGNGVFEEYERPVYVYQGGHPDINATDILFLIYSGDRWFGVYQPNGRFLLSEELRPFFNHAMKNYHAFWDTSYSSTVIVSDPTVKDTPVGVDFYWVGERGDQFGPYGALSPIQLYNQTGRGYFRCTDSSPFEIVDHIQNITGPGGRILRHTGGLFGRYLWLGETN